MPKATDVVASAMHQQQSRQRVPQSQTEQSFELLSG